MQLEQVLAHGDLSVLYGDRLRINNRCMIANHPCLVQSISLSHLSSPTFPVFQIHWLRSRPASNFLSSNHLRLYVDHGKILQNRHEKDERECLAVTVWPICFLPSNLHSHLPIDLPTYLTYLSDFYLPCSSPYYRIRVLGGHLLH